MKRDEFLTRLSAHMDAGRLDEVTYKRIQAHELAEVIGLGADQDMDDQPSIVDGSDDGFKEHAMRFSLGVVAAIGSTLVLIGFGLLASLVEDETSVDVVVPLFALLACAAYFAPGVNVMGRALVFVGEARAIIFGTALMISLAWFLGEIIDTSYGETLGPLNIFEWAPALSVTVLALTFARRMQAWVAYCAGWFLWFYPMILAIEQPNEIYAAISLIVVMGVLFSELWREWFGMNRPVWSAVQATFNAMIFAIFAWISLYVFADALDDDLITPVFYVIAWFVWMKVIPERFSNRTYRSSKIDKSWPSVLGVMVFYTGLPLYTGFKLAEESGLRDIDIIGFNLTLGFVYAILLHGLMGLQMFDWKAEDVVLRPSLTQPGTFVGSVFFIMAFVWFIVGLIDFLEEIAGYIFLPMGLIVLFLGTKRLMAGSSSITETE